MARLAPHLFPALVLAALATAVVPACDAAAQGFNSVSSAAPTVSPVGTQPFGSVSSATSVSPASLQGAPAGVTRTPEPAPPAPVATTASLGSVDARPSAPQGFSSISGAAPSLPVAAAASGAGPSPAGSASSELADKVLVDKSERRLYLLRGSRVIAEYPIKLGLNPYGHKQREGDFRTPEGKYTLVRRNPESEFYLSIQVSYPNREDAAVAKENGHAPGGLIMIHGQPNVPKRSPEFYASRDWTDGCIALSNSDMIDVWQRTTLGIPIEIRR